MIQSIEYEFPEFRLSRHYFLGFRLRLILKVSTERVHK